MKASNIRSWPRVEATPWDSYQRIVAAKGATSPPGGRAGIRDGFRSVSVRRVKVHVPYPVYLMLLDRSAHVRSGYYEDRATTINDHDTLLILALALLGRALSRSGDAGGSKGLLKREARRRF